MAAPSPYVELHCHSGFSFLDGASHVDELVRRAVELGYPALALTDHDGLYGSMEFAHAAKGAGLHPITGAELTLRDCFPERGGDQALSSKRLMSCSSASHPIIFWAIFHS